MKVPLHYEEDEVGPEGLRAEHQGDPEAKEQVEEQPKDNEEDDRNNHVGGDETEDADEDTFAIVISCDEHWGGVVVVVVKFGGKLGLVDPQTAEDRIDQVIVVGAPFLSLRLMDASEEGLDGISIETFMVHVGKEVVKTDEDVEHRSEN